MTERNSKRGQFSIVAALLVSIVLVTAVITTYSIVRNNPTEDRPEILGSIDEMNLAVKHILEFTVGYYGSILQVTGNTSYAKNLAFDYLQRSLANTAYTHPKLTPTFHVNYFHLSAAWFNQTSRSQGAVNVTYSLTGLGISGIRYSTTAELTATVSPSATSSVLINITRDGSYTCPNLGQNNFFFYEYSYTNSEWKLINTGLVINSVNSLETYSVYDITVPISVDPSSYMLQVVDTRGIVVVASTFSNYIYDLGWNEALYSQLDGDTIVVEALQNGTFRWLGQNLELETASKPIPPIPVRGFRLNRTVNGASEEAMFQTESWGSNYRVPLGLTSNVSLFGSRQMLVFLVDHEVERITLWWDGRDIANQTEFAWKNTHFNDDPDAYWNYGILRNGLLELRVYNFRIEARVVGGSTSSTAYFLRINNDDPTYGARPAYVIYNGVVRDIVQQEAEWSGGIQNCPNVYSHIVITFAADATYYTYSSRLIFTDSSLTRTITDLSALRLSVSTGEARTENGTSGGYPLVSNGEGVFYNFTFPTGWSHHWSQFNSGNSGAGIMFTDEANEQLYSFDSVAGGETGAIRVIRSYYTRIIELNPVELLSTSFANLLDIQWSGAVVTFEGDPIYPDSGNIGLWIIVEHPPTVSVS